MDSNIENFDGVPIGWEIVRLTDSELDQFCAAADVGDHDEAERVVDGAYSRLFGEAIN